jgi:hypothetical protein
MCGYNHFYILILVLVIMVALCLSDDGSKRGSYIGIEDGGSLSQYLE